MDALTFLTFEDVIRAGACTDGVLSACDSAGFYAGTIENALSIFNPSQQKIIMQAGRLSGYCTGDYSGYGQGDIYGDGYGDGDGYGYGYGYGYGDGDGDGDGDGYGYGDGDGDGYGYGE